MATEETKAFLNEYETSSNSSDGWEYTAKRSRSRHGRSWKSFLLGVLIIMPWTLLAVNILWTLKTFRRCPNNYYITPELTYSPAQEVVEYQTKIFTTGLREEEDSAYAAEPSDEVDKLWTDLYPSLIQLIPKDQAAQLVNKTVMFPHDEQKRYAVELDVFHELHCLNMVRKATRPDYYHEVIEAGETEDPLLGRRHVAHCIDAIRQSLMCASDITPYTWTYDTERGVYVNHVRNPHTCRNFDKIRDWSVVNTKYEYFDFESPPENDPLDPTTWKDGYFGD